MIFKNRKEAGQQLATALASYARLPNHLVVGLARGGIIVAREVALALKLPLEVLVVRKIGAPTQPELAMGAMAGDVILFQKETVEMEGVTQKELTAIIDQERQELFRREKLYRSGRKMASMQDKTILLIDDGIATGLTLKASIQFLKKCKVQSIVLAVPVASSESIAQMKKEVNHVLCLTTPDYFLGVSQFYQEFRQVTDEEVCNALKSQ